MPSYPVLATDLTREHALELVKIEAAELEKLRKIYEQGRLEVLARLASLKPETFTAQHYRAVAAQIKAGLAAMTRKLEGAAGESVAANLETGVAQTLKEIAYWEGERGFQGGAFGRIQLDALRRISTPEALLLNQYQASLDSYGADLIGEMQRRLGKHLVKRSSWREMSLDIAGPLQGAGIQGARWKAERIVRTEMIHALNSGHREALNASKALLPGLAQQWDATLDERTSAICEELNGEVRQLGQVWEYHGREIANPPAHPNCRSRLIPWMAEWAAKAPKAKPEKQSAAPTAAMVQKAKEALPTPWPETQAGAPQRITLPSGKVADLYGGSSGSNPGGFYRTLDGEDLFVKFPPSVGQVGAEYAAAELARLMGLRTKDYTAWLAGADHVGIGSPRIQFQTLGGSELAGWANREELATHFAHATWVRNWDSVGIDFANLVKLPSGELMGVDYGGSLLWRAQGALKGDGMPAVVAELKTFLDPKLNPQTLQVFGALDPELIAKVVQQKLVGITDAEIAGIVARGHFTAADAKVIEAGLIARRESLRKWSQDILDAADKSPAGISKKILQGLPADPDAILVFKPGVHIGSSNSIRSFYKQALDGAPEMQLAFAKWLMVGGEFAEIELNRELGARFLLAAFQKKPAMVLQEMEGQTALATAIARALKINGKLGQIQPLLKEIANQEGILAAEAAAQAAKDAAALAAKAEAKKLAAEAAEKAAAEAAAKTPAGIAKELLKDYPKDFEKGLAFTAENVPSGMTLAQVKSIWKDLYPSALEGHVDNQRALGLNAYRGGLGLVKDPGMGVRFFLAAWKLDPAGTEDYLTNYGLDDLLAALKAKGAIAKLPQEIEAELASLAKAQAAKSGAGLAQEILAKMPKDPNDLLSWAPEALAPGDSLASTKAFFSEVYTKAIAGNVAEQVYLGRRLYLGTSGLHEDPVNGARLLLAAWKQDAKLVEDALNLANAEDLLNALKLKGATATGPAEILEQVKAGQAAKAAHATAAEKAAAAVPKPTPVKTLDGGPVVSEVADLIQSPEVALALKEATPDLVPLFEAVVAYHDVDAMLYLGRRLWIGDKSPENKPLAARFMLAALKRDPDKAVGYFKSMIGEAGGKPEDALIHAALSKIASEKVFKLGTVTVSDVTAQIAIEWVAAKSPTAALVAEVKKANEAVAAAVAKIAEADKAQTAKIIKLHAAKDADQTLTAESIATKLLGDLPKSATADGVKVGKAGLVPFEGHQIPSAVISGWAEAVAGNATRQAQMGRRLWTGTPDVALDHDLSLRFLLAAWNQDQTLVLAELAKFQATMEPVSRALKAAGYKETDIAVLAAEIGRQKKLLYSKELAEKASAEATAKLAAKEAQLAAEQAAAELVAKKAAFEAKRAAELAARGPAAAEYQAALEAYKVKVAKLKLPAKTTKTGDLTSAYRKRLQTWNAKLNESSDAAIADASQKARRVLFEANVEITRLRERLVQVEAEIAEYSRWALRRERRELRQQIRSSVRSADTAFKEEIERLAANAGILPKKPVPPPGMRLGGGAARPYAFRNVHPTHEDLRREWQAVGEARGMTPAEISRDHDRFYGAISDWKGDPAHIKAHQNGKLPETHSKYRDAVSSSEGLAGIFEDVKGYEGELWRGESWVGGTSAEQAASRDWMLNHLATSDVIHFPYSAGFSTLNGFKGHGYGGGKSLQYHIVGKSSARSVANVASHEGERELIIKPGSTYRVLHWHREGDQGIWITMEEIFADGTTGAE